MPNTKLHPKLLGSLTALVGLTAWSPAMAVEEHRYTVLQTWDDVELRRYEPVVVAEVEVQAPFEDAGNRAFRPLAGYIFGGNRRDQKIAMTAPVLQSPREVQGERIAMTAPVLQQGSAQTSIVRFVMPAEHDLASLPTPVDPSVKLRQLDAQTVAAIRYSGRWTEESYRKHLVTLRSQLKARGLEEAGEPVWARYNAPYTPWFLRRNEVLIPVRSN